MEKMTVRNMQDAERVVNLHIIRVAETAIEQGGYSGSGGTVTRWRGIVPTGIPAGLGSTLYIQKTPAGAATTLGRAARGQAKLAAGLATDRDLATLARDYALIHDEVCLYDGPRGGGQRYGMYIPPLTVQTRKGESLTIHETLTAFSSCDLGDDWDIIRNMKTSPLRENMGKLEFKPSATERQKEAWLNLARHILESLEIQCIKQSA